MKFPSQFASLAGSWRSDLPASLVVFLVALPLCMGIAIASGVPVAAGLISGIVGGIVVGCLAGAPLQVAGPAAGLTVLVYQTIQEFGVESLGVLVLACGVFQIVFGICRLGVWFRAVSPAVIHGMMAGIGVLIFAGQFHVMVDDKPKGSGWQNLITIPQAVQKGFPPPALETAEERAAIRSDMQRLSALHQHQTELLEQVHHLLAGVSGEAAPAKPAMPDEAADSDEDVDGDEAAAEADLETELALAAELEALAPQQRAIVDELRAFASEHGVQAKSVALPAAEAALADLEGGEIHRARASQDAAEAQLRSARDTTKHHRWAATVGILTIAILVGWQTFVGRRFKVLPAALVAVAVMTAVATLWKLPILFVEVPDQLFSEAFFPNAAELRSLLQPSLLLVAFEFAVIASAETLLSATAVDKMHSGPRANYDRELMAQGVGNICCGLLRALPITGVIVRSSVNVENGAKSRLSTILHGTWLLLFVVGFAWLLRLVPTSALAAVLVFTGYRLIDYKGAIRLWRESRFEAVIFVATAAVVVGVGLLQGVVTGIVLAVLKLIFEFSRLEVHLQRDAENERYVLVLRGSATFLRLPYLARVLGEVPPDAELHLNVEDLDMIDHACRDLLHDWARENEPFGGTLIVDRESLAARFWRRPRHRHEQNGSPVLTAKPKRERQVPI